MSGVNRITGWVDTSDEPDAHGFYKLLLKFPRNASVDHYRPAVLTITLGPRRSDYVTDL